MKKYLFIILFIYSLYFSFSQPYSISFKKSKYGIVFKNGEHKYLNQRKHFLKFLEEITNVPRQDKLGKFAQIDSHKFDIDSKKNLPDSLISFFKINKIIIKRNNYQNIKGKLKKQTIYLIDIECVNNDSIDCPQYIRLISVNTKTLNKKNKIKVGEIYKMKIYSYFKKDIFSSFEYNGEIVNDMRGPGSYFYSIIYLNIWIAYIDFNSYNWFESSNLKGLYYIPPEGGNVSN